MELKQTRDLLVDKSTLEAHLINYFTPLGRLLNEQDDAVVGGKIYQEYLVANPDKLDLVRVIEIATNFET